MPEVPSSPATPSQPAHRASPTVSGQLISIAATPASRGDRPWWVPLTYLFALIPLLMALAAITAMRAVVRAFSLGALGGRRAGGDLMMKMLGFGGGSGGAHPGALTSLVSGVLQDVLGYRLKRATDPHEYSLMRLRAGKGETVCRYMAAPATLPVARGDHLLIWGRSGDDGVIRARRLENRSVGATHTAPLVPSAVAIAAIVFLAFWLMILTAAT